MESCGSRQSLDDLGSFHHISKPEGKPSQTRLVLCLACRPTRIFHEPRLESSIERRPGRGVAAAVRHDATNYHSLHLLLLQDVLQIGVDEGVVGVLCNHRAAGGLRGNRGLELPVFATRGDGSRWAPLPY